MLRLLGHLIQGSLFSYWVCGRLFCSFCWFFFFNSMHLKICQPAQVQVMITEPGNPAAQGMPPGLLWALFASLKVKFLFCLTPHATAITIPSDYDIWELIFSNKFSRNFSISIFHCPISRFPKCRCYQQISPGILILFINTTNLHFTIPDLKVINIKEGSSRGNSEWYMRQPE